MSFPSLFAVAFRSPFSFGFAFWKNKHLFSLNFVSFARLPLFDNSSLLLKAHPRQITELGILLVGFNNNFVALWINKF